MSEISKDLVRISKYIAECGVASRRKAEELVTAGKVSVNGKVVKDLATKVTSKDRVSVSGRELRRQTEVKVWGFYKPKGCLTTSHDPQGRKTVYDVLPKYMANKITVGRLDYNTEGLLLLTNNGDFARKMELPTSKISREYRVRVYGRVSDEIISKIRRGINHNGMKYKPCEAFIEEGADGANTWVRMVLTEGKNREIRNIFEAFDMQVNKLVRVSYGPFSLDGMKAGQLIEAPSYMLEGLVE
jgi:23S rRNA pseudouridine2605 synthase